MFVYITETTVYKVFDNNLTRVTNTLVTYRTKKNTKLKKLNTV